MIYAGISFETISHGKKNVTIMTYSEMVYPRLPPRDSHITDLHEIYGRELFHSIYEVRVRPGKVMAFLRRTSKSYLSLSYLRTLID